MRLLAAPATARLQEDQPRRTPFPWYGTCSWIQAFASVVQISASLQVPASQPNVVKRDPSLAMKDNLAGRQRGVDVLGQVVRKQRQLAQMGERDPGEFLVILAGRRRWQRAVLWTALDHGEEGYGVLDPR